MDWTYEKIFFIVLLLSFFVYVHPTYNVWNHPCCQEPSDNISLALIIDAFEIYGHDPTDKLDNLAHYQIEMMKIKKAVNQWVINEHVHIATDHLGRFINLHIKEMKVLLIALDDVIDNMLTMYDNHNAIKAERVATQSSAYGGAVPSEFYLSQEYYCGKNVYVFISEQYSDIYNMGRGPAPFCRGRAFYFLNFVHYADDKKYYLIEDPSMAFQMDNYAHGLECHSDVCIFRFRYDRSLEHPRDVKALPKAIVKCGLIVYKLPPLSASSCTITSGTFILDFNIQGLRFRHRDYLLYIPNGITYYTKEIYAPLICDHHVCEWNYTNFYGGPFIVPGEPEKGESPIPPFIDRTTTDSNDKVTTPKNDFNNTYELDGCWFYYPPNYGSIAGISYLDPLTINEYRYTCTGNGNKAGLYWYPQWMGAPPHHPYMQEGNLPQVVAGSDIFFPHQELNQLEIPTM